MVENLPVRFHNNSLFLKHDTDMARVSQNMVPNKYRRKFLYAIYEGISYLEKNYTKEITTEQLAVLCNMSESNFRRLFHRYSTLSPITYRNFLRMKHAREMLETGLYTVSEAAAIVNITDPFYFNKMFKKYFGTAPSNVIS